MRRRVLQAAISIALLIASAALVVGRESAITAFAGGEQTVPLGAALSFETGVTSNDGAPWPANTVLTSVEILDPDGRVVQNSPPVAAPDEIRPNETTFVFVQMTLVPSLPAGTYQARAVVRHNGAIVDTSETAPLAVGAILAQAPPVSTPPPGVAMHATLNQTSTLMTQSSQSGDLDVQGKMGNAQTFDYKEGVANPQSGTQPNLTFTTTHTVTQLGTYSLSIDDSVLSGPTGTGLVVKRNWDNQQSLEIAVLSGGHATENPFAVYGLGYNMPISKGTLSFTAGWVEQSGPVVATGLPDFLRRGELLGIAYKSPQNAAGFHYDVRYGLINYFDELSGVWRADRAMGADFGFRLLAWDWKLGYTRAGPYFPTLTASGAAPDAEDESIGASRTFGSFHVDLKATDSRTALNGSPGLQTGHVWNESLGLGYGFHNNDQLQLNLSNAVNHVIASTPTDSLNQNEQLSYSGARGLTTFQLSLGSATAQDNSGNTTHTITDSAQVSRKFSRNMMLTAIYTNSLNLANIAASTNIGQQLGLTATYGIGFFDFSSGYNWSLTKPFTGDAQPSSVGLNVGLGYKPHFSPTTIQATMTRNTGATSATTGRLSLSRQI